ncbi:MAG: Hydantoinase/oxoprolinase [Methanomassiliicoccales archaeon PtaU1.Bin124]|nr:MAG: Hydantoinase/oxoprolinase [Methanomassiliicoccales archaeon PtaU1.Bin124]
MEKNAKGSANLGLGIDTGGTYTDAAIMSMDDGTVLCKAKSLTTRNDLSLGIKGAIEKLDHSMFKSIHLVAISSTLATNSVVEGKGCRVGLILVGNDVAANIPVDEMVRIKGGHNLQGEAKEELDLDAAKLFILHTQDKVDGYAISSYLSVRNPEHEIALKAMVKSITDKPVVCGHELSTALGFNERTVTAILNARLIPIISDLIASLKKVQEELKIRAPLMIVKGDGSLMDESIARERPVETILSGPAASIIGAKALTKLQDAVIIDVGGTTTDIGILRGGRPRLDPEGAILGGWRTRVKAVDAFTSGIGGDSRVVVARNKIHLTPLRVIPLCIASSTYPTLRPRLEALKGITRWVPSSMDVESTPQIHEYYIFSRYVGGPEVGPEQGKVLEILKGEPLSIYEIAEKLSTHPLSLNLRKMEELGMIQRIGLTPTDILHAEGSYVEYDAEASKLAVEIQSAALEIPPSEFIHQVKTMVIEKIATEVFKKLVFEEVGEQRLEVVANSLINNMIRSTGRRDFACKLEVNKPLIGIGAPVGAYLPGVAERFHTTLVLPEHSEVGNAAGAVSGNVMETVEMLIKPKKGMGSLENPPCILYWAQEKKEFEELTEALAYAKLHGSDAVIAKAKASGADTVEVLVDNHRNETKLDKGWGGNILLELKLTVTGIGKPKLFYEGKR